MERDQLDLAGNPVLDARGEPIGRVAAVVLDEWTGRPAFVRIDLDADRGNGHVVPTIDCSTVRDGATTAVMVHATPVRRLAALDAKG